MAPSAERLLEALGPATSSGERAPLLGKSKSSNAGADTFRPAPAGSAGDQKDSAAKASSSKAISKANDRTADASFWSNPYAGLCAVLLIIGLGSFMAVRHRPQGAPLPALAAPVHQAGHPAAVAASAHGATPASRPAYSSGPQPKRNHGRWAEGTTAPTVEAKEEPSLENSSDYSYRSLASRASGESGSDSALKKFRSKTFASGTDSDEGVSSLRGSSSDSSSTNGYSAASTEEDESNAGMSAVTSFSASCNMELDVSWTCRGVISTALSAEQSRIQDELLKRLPSWVRNVDVQFEDGHLIAKPSVLLTSREDRLAFGRDPEHRLMCTFEALMRSQKVQGSTKLLSEYSGGMCSATTGGVSCSTGSSSAGACSAADVLISEPM